MPFHAFKLNDGRYNPAIAFGSSGIAHSDVVRQIGQAVDAGFEHIDTAQSYGNEKDVGDAVKAIKLPRDKVWVTTKWSDGSFDAFDACQQSLKLLDLEYVDLYLIHSPRVCKGDIVAAWKKMEEIHSKGWAKSIGVSNFNVEQLQEILDNCSIPPAVNQIQVQPYGISGLTPLLGFMASKGIVCEGYSPNYPLRNPDTPLAQLIHKIGAKNKIQDDQVCLAWAKAKGAILVTKSSKKERLEGYVAVGDIDLPAEDVEAIDRAGAAQGQS